MSETFNELERRVLGVLIEKALSQPAYYPMTLTAITAACNQKSNRDPFMELDEDAVWNTVDVLRSRGLITRLLPGGSARAERFKHECSEKLGWEKPQRAIMAELLLRGPQTLNELRTRAARMYTFENNDAASATLETLIQRDPPHVRLLPRAPGQREPRYMHLLYPSEEQERVAASISSGAAAGGAGTGEFGSRAGREAVAAMPSSPDFAAKLAEIDELRDTVVELRREIDDLRHRLDRLGG